MTRSTSVRIVSASRTLSPSWKRHWSAGIIRKPPTLTFPRWTKEDRQKDLHRAHCSCVWIPTTAVGECESSSSRTHGLKFKKPKNEFLLPPLLPTFPPPHPARSPFRPPLENHREGTSPSTPPKGPKHLHILAGLPLSRLFERNSGQLLGQSTRAVLSKTN